MKSNIKSNCITTKNYDLVISFIKKEKEILLLEKLVNNRKIEKSLFAHFEIYLSFSMSILLHSLIK